MNTFQFDENEADANEDRAQPHFDVKIAMSLNLIAREHPLRDVPLIDILLVGKWLRKICSCKSMPELKAIKRALESDRDQKILVAHQQSNQRYS